MPAGAERVAVLLRLLGEKQAANVLKFMDRGEVQAVSQAMMELESVPGEKIKGILDQLKINFMSTSALGIGSNEYVRGMLEGALGPERAHGVLSNMSGGSLDALEELGWMEADGIVGMIRNEHPQVIAVVLQTLDSSLAAEVLGALHETIQTDVLARMATLESIKPSVFDHLKRTLFTGKKGFSSQSDSKSRLGGLKHAAKIMNELDVPQLQKLQEMLREKDSELAEQLDEMMIVFENLVDVDSRGMQKLLREVDSDQLVVALKGASQTLKDKIFGNMSTRAAELLLDDLEIKGPVKLVEVEEAQKAIVTAARRLADEGALTFGQAGGDYVG